MKSINFYLLEYSIGHILRYRYKNLFTFISMSLLVFLLSSLFFISNSIKYELNQTLDQLPDIIIQNQKAGIKSLIDESLVYDILEINGVRDVKSRVWGYYTFKKAGINLSLVGVDEFDLKSQDINTSSVLVGQGVREMFDKYYYHDYFNFIKEDGDIKRLYISGTFDEATQLESNDIVVMDKDTLREIFGIDDGLATDIAIYVTNNSEIPTIAYKLQEKYQNMKIITKEDIATSYENLFDYKNGIFLSLFIISLFTFFVIVYDRMSGVSSEQKHEIGVLKAIGWRVEDVLKAKLYEGVIVSLFSYITGVSAALVFVYIFQAPLLRDIFMGYSSMDVDFKLPFVLDIDTLFIVFLLSVPIYVASIIIPSWKLSTLDADEVLR